MSKFIKSLECRFGAFIGFAIILGANFLSFVINDPVYEDRFVFDNDYQAGFLSFCIIQAPQ